MIAFDTPIPLSWILLGGLLCAGALALRKRWPALALAWLCYLMLLLPFFRDQFPGQQLLADRHTYLASLPLALCIGVAAGQSRFLVAGNWQGIQRFFGCAGIIETALGGIGVLARRQIK
jgi:peptidoglycan/LPS O-acetylase OafA/YrhL